MTGKNRFTSKTGFVKMPLTIKLLTILLQRVIGRLANVEHRRVIAEALAVELEDRFNPQMTRERFIKTLCEPSLEPPFDF